MKTSDNGWRWVLSRGKVVETDEKGNPVRIIGTHMDITERKKMMERLKQAQKLEAIGTLAGGIAHDFNNILSPLVGWAEILKMGLPPGDPACGHVDKILAAAWRARDLVLQILTFSRGEDSKAAPVKLQPMIKEAVKLLRSSIPATIDIKTQIDESCPMVMADGVQIHRVLINLATNAFHAMEETGGLLRLSLQRHLMEKDAFSGGDLAPGGYALIRVSDTGCGIEKDVLSKIFDPYFTTKAKGKGTGLGLSMVRGIVQTFKGDIRVYSEPGKGTEVRVFLPLMDDGAQINPPRQPDLVMGGTERILYVDDEEAIVSMAREMLTQMDYHVTGFTSSEKALEKFKSDPFAFDLVITDLTMPRLTGDQLAREIMAVRPRTPMIICTGFSDRMDEAKCREMGIGGFIMKPISRKELTHCIRRVLEKNQSGRDRQRSTS